MASAGPAPAGKSQAGRYGWCPASLGRQTCDPGDHLGGIWRPPGLGFLVLAGVWALGAMVTRSEGTVGGGGGGPGPRLQADICLRVQVEGLL